MKNQVSQGISEERLQRIEEGAEFFKDAPKARETLQVMVAEVRRLKQREADLLTALNLQEGINKELIAEKTAAEGALNTACARLGELVTGPSWTNQEPEDDNGEYARGLRR